MKKAEVKVAMMAAEMNRHHAGIDQGIGTGPGSQHLKKGRKVKAKPVEAKRLKQLFIRDLGQNRERRSHGD